jgi:chorismate mutase
MSANELWNEIHRLSDQVRDVRANVDHRLAGFNLALLLLSAATDAAGCKQRLAELRKELTSLDKAQAELAAAREAHAREVAEASAELDRRRTKVAESEADLRLRRAAFDQREASRETPTSSAPDFPFDPNLNPGTRWRGLTRANHHE